MRVEDAAARAGADLRARFGGVPAPELGGRVRGSPARAGVVAAAVVVLFAVGLTAVVRSVRTSPTEAGGSGGPMWQKISIAKAFGAHAVVTNIDEIASGFIALGFEDRGWKKYPAGSSRQPELRPRLFRAWTSSDGVRWDRQATHGIPAFTSGDGGYVVQSGHQYVLVKMNEIFRSSDLLRWRRVPAFNRAGSVAVRRWRHGFDAVVDESVSADTQNWKHYRSEDGVRWVRIDDPNPSPLILGAFNAVRVGGRWLALVDENGDRRLYTSPDREHWAPLASNAPRLIDLLVPDRVRRRVLTIEYHAATPDVVTEGDGLWSTTNGAEWAASPAFHSRYPATSIDHPTVSGDWIVLGGQRRSPRREATMWASPDLKHWYELPVGMRKHRSGGSYPRTTGYRNTVVGLASEGTELVIWHRPRRAPTLVTLSGEARSVGGPRGAGSIVHSVRVRDAGGREITRVQVSTDGHYVVDLPPGQYRLRTECTRDRVTLRRADVRRNLVCQTR